jgi:DNA-binding response OmpR family regulator
LRDVIVVADDNADMRHYLKHLLGGRYDVHTAADGTQALDAARRVRPALLLADVMMPQLDGFALLRAIRDDGAIASMPIILLSARAGEESRVEGLQAGADDYLVKPFTARELLARVEAHLKLATLRRDTAEREERLRMEAELERQRLHASQELLAETSRLYHELQHREAEIRALKDQLARENLALRDEVDRTSMFEEIVGSSDALKLVLSRIAKVAPTDSTVLIAGAIGPEPHPNFIEVLRGAPAVPSRTGLETPVGHPRVGHCPRSEERARVSAVVQQVRAVSGASRSLVWGDDRGLDGRVRLPGLNPRRRPSRSRGYASGRRTRPLLVGHPSRSKESWCDRF